MTGNLYARNRDYDPDLGRFTSLDPIRYGSGERNHYLYVSNNPLTYSDPLGLEKQTPETQTKTIYINKGMKDGKAGWRIRYAVDVSYIQKSDTAGLSAFRLPVSVTFHLVISLRLAGPGIQSLLNPVLPQWIDAVDKQFNNWQLHGRVHVAQGNQELCPEVTIPLKFKVNFVYGGDGDQNVTVKDSVGRSNMTNFFLRGQRQPSAFLNPSFHTFVHEVGHMFGLKDEYTDPILYPDKVPPPDKDQSIMYSSAAGNILQRHIEDIVNVSGIRAEFPELRNMAVIPRVK